MNKNEELQEQELIELKYVARALNELVGADFRVIVNGSTSISQDSKTEILMQATRIPFAVTGIGSETLNISLEVWAPAQNPKVRDKTLSMLNKLIGHKSGSIETTEANYTYASFLEFGRPIDVQQVDINASRRHLLNITGTMLISNVETGAVVSNSIFTQLYIGNPDDENTVRGFIPTLAVDTSINFSSETSPTGNNNTADTYNIVRNCNISVSALVLNRPLDNVIIKIIYLIQNNFGINDEIYVRRIFPTFEVIKKCRLIGGELIEQAGAYMQYKLSLIEVP